MGSISDLFGEVVVGSQAERRIVEFFEQQARSFAASLLSNQLRTRVSASDVVNAAMRSALSEIEHGRASISNRTEFASLLLAIVRRKIQSEARKWATDTRDIDKNAPFEAASAVPSKELGPEQRAELQEFTDKAKQVLVQLAAEDENPRKSTALYLAVLCDWSAKSIKDLLDASYPNAPKVEVRTIQRWRAHALDVLKRRLEAHADLLNDN